MNARFIALEGIDGVGKSTLAKALMDSLQSDDIPSVLTREPGGSPRAEEIRTLLVARNPEDNFCPDTQLLLHYAARFQHLEDTVLPALRTGKVVVCDRFEISSYSYQVSGHSGSKELFLKMHEEVIKKLRTVPATYSYVHCELNPEEARVRMEADKVRAGIDVHDSLPSEFHLRVQEGVREAKQHIDPLFEHHTIETDKPPEQLALELRKKLDL